MVFLKPFHFPIPSLTIPNSCDQENNTCSLLPWLLLTVISSIFAYALCSGFHLLSFLLTCSALLISTCALPFMRPNSTASQRSKEAQLSTSTVLKKEEPIVVQETIGNCEQDPDPDPTQECSDGSISDEESLIEIALPSGYYIDPKKHDEQQPLKWWSECYSIESFQQQGQDLMAELLAEINEFCEEENMIEIDLSMGSIMCPRFEIKA